MTTREDTQPERRHGVLRPGLGLGDPGPGGSLSPVSARTGQPEGGPGR